MRMKPKLAEYVHIFPHTKKQGRCNAPFLAQAWYFHLRDWHELRSVPVTSREREARSPRSKDEIRVIHSGGRGDESACNWLAHEFFNCWGGPSAQQQALVEWQKLETAGPQLHHRARPEVAQLAAKKK